MKKIPHPLKLAITLGILGGIIGAVIGGYLGAEYYKSGIGFLFGYTLGFIIGYLIGNVRKTIEAITFVDRLSAGVSSLAIILGFIFVIAGIFALILKGWNSQVFLAILFFLTGSLYLTHKHYRQ